MLFTDLTSDLFEPLVKRWHQHPSPLFRTPDHMIMAGIEDIPVAFVGHLIHRFSIQQRAIYVKTFVLDTDRPLLPLPKKVRALHPHG
jgi:hypothetical protein